jgi:hypothetical protein
VNGERSIGSRKVRSVTLDGVEVKRVHERSEATAAKVSVVRTAPVEIGVRTKGPAANGNPEMVNKRSGMNRRHSTR